MHNGTRASLNTFFTFPGEKLLVAKRPHWIVLLPPLLIVALGGALLFVGTIFIFSYLLPFHSLTLLVTLVITSGVIFLITKIILEWLFHLYIVTNRKILEFSYMPLSHYMVNDVILDQVRCTEIDIQADGVLNDLLNIGDITITFDRPTHQEEFHLLRIHNAREIGSFLTSHLMDIYASGNRQQVRETWIRSKSPRRKYQRLEEIIPEEAVEPEESSERTGGILYG